MNCGEILAKGEETPALGHKMSDWVVIKTPTSTEKGLKQKKCETCGFGVTDVIPMIITLSTPSVSTKNTANGINVSWNAVENGENYIVYRRTYNAKTKKYSGWTILANAYVGTNYTDTKVVLGTTYSYAVRAVNGDVKSKYTATKGLTYNVTPTVKVANASNGVKVSWSTAANATGYTIYSSTYNAKTKKWSGWTNCGTTKANVTSWVDKKATKSGTYYKYTVRAICGSVKSSFNKTGVSTLYLAQPTVKIANASTGVKVAWNKIAGAKGYTIYRQELVNGKWTSWKNMGTIKSGATVSWTDTTAKSGTTYRYTARAINGSYKGAYKASGSLLYLAQPTVKIANASNGIKVSWNKIDGATGYTVYSSTYNAKTKKWSGWTNRGTATADKTSWTDKKVTSGVQYKYTVRAVNGKIASTYKSTAGLRYLAQPSFDVSKNNSGVNITWNKILGATGYRVYRKANNETKWSTLATIKSTSYVDKNVSTDGIYTYTVRAYNGKVWSSYNTKGVTISLDYKKAVLELVNEERIKAGLEPLEYYSSGQKAGDIRAKEIVKKFEHERPDGTMCFTVFEEVGISCYSAGENIAIGFYTPESVMDAWMNSPGHRANILNPSFTHLIVGYDYEEKAWVQLFLGNPYTA